MENNNLRTFFNDWQRMIDGAKLFTQNNEFPSIGAQIPFFPLEIDIKSFYYVWLEFYKLFMNSNANSLELIVDKNNEIIKCFLHKANNDGMYIQLVNVGVSNLPNISKDFENIDNIYKELKKWIKKEHSVDIGNIRIIPFELIIQCISIYENYCKRSSNIELLKMIGEYLDIFLKYLNHNHNHNSLVFYPKSPLIEYFNHLKDKFMDFSYCDILNIVSELLPKSKLTLTFKFKENANYLGYYIKINRGKILFEFISIPEEIFADLDDIEQKKRLLSYLKRKFHTPINLLIKIKDFVSFISDVIQTEIPIGKDRALFLIEKFLFLYRNIGKSWDMEPKPLIYNENIRFWIYAFKFYFNPRKLSYWAIPKIFWTFSSMFLGTTGKILILNGDKFPSINATSRVYNLRAITCTLEDGVIEEMQYISEPKIQEIMEKIKEPNSSILTQIRSQFSDKYGFISSVIYISNKMLSETLSILLIDFHRFNLVSGRKLIKIIRFFRNSNEFSMFPENPVYLTLKEQFPLVTLKKIAPIFTDMHEF